MQRYTRHLSRRAYYPRTLDDCSQKLPEVPRHLAISGEASRNANQRAIIIARIRRLWRCWVFVSARVPWALLKTGGARGPDSLQDPREPEKSRATNGMWQRVISPRLRARRNNRFLFPSFRGPILPQLLPRTSLHTERPDGIIPAALIPVPVAQSYGFASETLLRPAPTSSHETGYARRWLSPEPRTPGNRILKALSYAHVCASGARGDFNDDRGDTADASEFIKIRLEVHTALAFPSQPSWRNKRSVSDLFGWKC